jgi:tetratricopeptide (TPR) repeat protein
MRGCIVAVWQVKETKLAEIDSKHRLGDLVIDLDMVSREHLEEALSISRETSLPLGRVLVMSNLMSDEDLKNVVRCQTLLKEHAIELKLAKQAMAQVRQMRITLDESLALLGWDSVNQRELVPLGKLLMAANFVSRNQLERALEKHEATGLPFGRILVLGGVLSESLLSAAVNAQILVRDKKLTEEQAVEALKVAARRQISIEVLLKEKGFYDLPNRSCPRIGEILLFCDLISPNELVNALEVGLVAKKPIGEVLVDAKLLNNEILQAVLHVQNLIAESKLTINEAKELVTAVKGGATFHDAMKGISLGHNTGQPARISLSKFLQMIGYASPADINQAFEVAQHNSQIMMQVLTVAGIADETTLVKAEHCRMLVQNGRLTLEHAGIVLDYAQRRGIGIPEALRELQWQHGDGAAFNDLKPIKQIKLKTLSQSQWLNLKGTAEQFMVKGQFKAARDVWTQLLELDQDQGENYGRCLDAIAETYLAEQDFADAKVAYQRALKFKTELFGAESLPVSLAVSNIGKVAYFSKDYDVAESCAKEYIRVCSVRLGKEHPDVACGWQNLATLYHVQNKHTDAENAYRVAIGICSQALGSEHPTTARLNRNYANLLHNMNKIREAAAVDPFAQGRITGSWRAIQLNDDQKLHG